MEDRLVQLLKTEGISPTRFAERIGVQRSSISHILSGRNKPSYDFIIKILDSFPSLNPDWLLRGKGLMYKNEVSVQPGLFDNLNRQTEEDYDKPKPAEDIPLTEDSEVSAAYTKTSVAAGISEIPAMNTEITQGKRVQKIVIFYSDRTFSDYIPEES